MNPRLKGPHLRTLVQTCARTLGAGLVVVASFTLASARGAGSSTMIAVSQRASDLTALYCYSAQDCLASTGNNIEASDDDGLHWRVVMASIGPTGGTGVESFACPAQGICYAEGGAYPDAVVVATLDGEHWVRHRLGDAASSSWYPWAIACASAASCVVGGGSGQDNDPGVMYRTLNAGATWVRSVLPKKTAQIWSIHCLSESNCVALAGIVPAHVPMGAGTNGFQIIASSNGGLTWTVRYQSGNYNPGNISCSGTTTCWAALEPNLDQPALGTGPTLVSTNGGESWRPLGLAENQRPTVIACVSTTTCWAAQLGRSAQFAGISRDGGSRWTWQRLVALSPPPAYPAGELYYPILTCGSISSCLLIKSTITAGEVLLRLGVP